MQVPSLAKLCVSTIVENENLLGKAQEEGALTSVALEMVNEGHDIKKTLAQWKWFVVPSENANTQEFQLATRNYKAFWALCFSNCVIKDSEFTGAAITEQYSLKDGCKLMEKAMRFVEAKGLIEGVDRGSGSHGNASERSHILLKYRILWHERVNFTEPDPSISLANIELPAPLDPTVKVSIASLNEINESIKQPWNEETYDDLYAFIIYYVNQLAIDNFKKKSYCWNHNNYRYYVFHMKTDQRLFATYHARSKKLGSIFLKSMRIMLIPICCKIW